MLEANDIKKIGAVVKESINENNKKLTKDIVGQVVLEVGEFIADRVLPQIDELSVDLEEVKQDLAEVKKTVTTLSTKDDVTRAATDVKGTIVAQLRKEDEKVNLLIKFLREQKILTEEQWNALRSLQVFPSVEL